MELKPLHSRLHTGSEELHTDRQWRDLLDSARMKAHYSRKQMAADMGISESQLSAQMSGDPKMHVSLWRMRGLSREFWQEFVTLLIEFYDLTVAVDPRTAAYAEIGRRVCEVMALSESTRRRV